MKPLKVRKCKICKQQYQPERKGQMVCGEVCAFDYVQKQTEKRAKEHALKRRVRDQERKDALKSYSDWCKEAQAAFNAYVRERDRDQPCISCGRHHTGQYHAGHYRDTAECPALRYHLWNVHKQCAPCNDKKSGNLLAYRKGLIHRIGFVRVRYLELDHCAGDYTIDQLKRIKSIFSKRARILRKRHAPGSQTGTGTDQK